MTPSPNGRAVSLDVQHKPGAVRLDEYSLLVYAPNQHGPGVRTEDRGVRVSDIVAAFARLSDESKVAAELGTTAAHVDQALSYASSPGAIL